MKKVLTLAFSLLLCLSLSPAFGAENLSFSSGEFKILILADPQDTGRPQQAMLDLLNASLDASDPDLVVFLGDMIHSFPIHRKRPPGHEKSHRRDYKSGGRARA